LLCDRAIVRLALCLGILAAGLVHARGEVGPAPAGMPLNMPLYFEANAGQVPAPFRFLSRGLEHNVLIAPTEIAVNLTKMDTSVPASTGRKFPLSQARILTRSFQVRFVGADTNATVDGAGELSARVNYLIGNDPAKWHTGVTSFGQVRVEGLYPGID